MSSDSNRQSVDGLPESMPVGPVYFDIVPLDGPTGAAGEKLWGEIDYSDLTIGIRQDLSRYHKLVTLFHEGFHSALDRAGYSHRLTEEEQEHLCDLVGFWLADLMEYGWLRIDPNPASGEK